MGTFTVSLYEPGIDPGGYFDSFVVEAADATGAVQAARAKARLRWPNARTLEVWEITQTR